MSKTNWDWIPKKKPGNIYCSPACGHKCTLTEYNAAVLAANELAESLGPTWKSHVWENGGWHYAAISECSRVKVTPRHGHGYIAYLGEAGTMIGGYWAETGETPHLAIEKTRKTAREELKRVLDLTSAIENVTTEAEKTPRTQRARKP